MGNDLSVARAARVLPNVEWREGEGKGTDKALISYMYKNKHSTPFEHVTFTFYVKAPIFVFRQWHRHRTWSFNEISGRYKELPEEFYIPDVDKIGTQSITNHQGRVFSKDTVAWDTREKYIQICEAAFQEYRNLLACGWPRELARCVLPLSTYSEMFATVNLWNLFRFISLRSAEHAQYEIQQYSNHMKELIRPIVPICMEVFESC